MLVPWKKSYYKPRQSIKIRDISLPTKVRIVKAIIFPVVMYGCELNHKEGWVPKNWCFQTVVLEKTLESLLGSKEIKPGIPKGNQPWIFLGRTDAEAEAPILWPPDAKSWLIGKDPDTGKYWRQEEKGMTEDDMVGWHHWLNGHDFEQAPGDGEGQRSLACCSPWGQKESTQLCNWTATEHNKLPLHQNLPKWFYKKGEQKRGTGLGYLKEINLRNFNLHL